MSQLGKGRSVTWAALTRFRLSLAPARTAPQAGNAKVFLITPGRIEEVLGLITEPKPAEVLRTALTLADGARRWRRSARRRRIGIVAHHLFSPKQGHGVFVRLDSIDEKTIARAYQEVKKQPAEEPVESEGVMKSAVVVKRLSWRDALRWNLLHWILLDCLPLGIIVLATVNFCMHFRKSVECSFTDGVVTGFVLIG